MAARNKTNTELWNMVADYKMQLAAANSLLQAEVNKSKGLTEYINIQKIKIKIKEDRIEELEASRRSQKVKERT